MGGSAESGGGNHDDTPTISGRNFSIGIPVSAETLKIRSAGTWLSAHWVTAPGVTLQAAAKVTARPRSALRYLRSSFMVSTLARL